MAQDGSAATAMLPRKRVVPPGLDGFVLLAVSEYAGELEQAVETTARELLPQLRRGGAVA